MILNINFKKYRESIFFKTQILSVNEQEHVKITHVEARLGFPSGSGVKDQPAIQEPQEQQIQSLGGEDPLEEGTATHSSILAWRIPCREEPGGLQFKGSQRARYN